MNKKLMRKKLALMLATLKKKRKYYTELEFLESTGTQYIDTGVDIGAEVELEFSFYATAFNGSTYCSPLSARRTNLINSISYAFNNGTTYASFGNNAEVQISPTITLNTKHVITQNKEGLWQDGNKTDYAQGYNTNFTETGHLYMFARNNLGSSVGNYFIGRTYYAKIWDNGVLVRDFIPVLDLDMTPCMYDRVTEQLFYNAGTGSFVAGRQIHPVEYLESTGTQYIDTGYIPTNTTGVQIKHTICADNETDNIIFGCRQDSADTRFWEDLDWGNDDSAGWGYGVYSNIDPTYSIYRYKLISSDIGKTVVSRLNYLNSRNCSINDNIRNLPQTTLPTITRPIYIFAGNNQGNAGYFTNFKVYEVQISEGSALVRDFIPAIDENGEGFMFDRVSHTIYDNAGTGAFKYPAREVEYLKTDGENLIYINPALSYFPDFEVGIKCDANTDRNVTLGTDANNMFERLSATQPYWTLHASGSVFMSSVGVSTYVDAKYKDGVFSSNGNTVGTKANTFPSGTFYLFRAPTNENAYKMSVYFFKAWDNNGVLVRDFIPCYKDGALGMWDKANNVFYPNSGTGTFTTSKIVEPEYE